MDEPKYVYLVLEYSGEMGEMYVSRAFTARRECAEYLRDLKFRKTTRVERHQLNDRRRFSYMRSWTVDGFLEDYKKGRA